jgi:hypothetical protein
LSHLKGRFPTCSGVFLRFPVFSLFKRDLVFIVCVTCVYVVYLDALSDFLFSRPLRIPMDSLGIHKHLVVFGDLGNIFYFFQGPKCIQVLFTVVYGIYCLYCF